MAFFIGLGKFTEQGVKNIKEVAENAPNVIAALPGGTKVHSMYVTQGQYDLVTIIEAPDAEAALKATVGVSMRGNTRWETLPAVTMDRFRELISG
jgi:uncharacterized protein with GYD domain